MPVAGDLEESIAAAVTCNYKQAKSIIAKEYNVNLFSDTAKQ